MITSAPFRRFMVEKEMSFEQIRDVTGMNITVIKDFYNDKRVSLRTVGVLCDVFNLQPSDLIRYEEE